jgi:hypothetical protein
MSRRRTIARRYPVGPFVVITYRQEPGCWYVTRPNRVGALCRVILPPFRSYGAAVVAAHMLAAQPA